MVAELTRTPASPAPPPSVLPEAAPASHAPAPSPGPASSRDRLIGIAGALVAVSIWGGWIVATRHAVSGHLPPVAVGWLRFVVTAVVLAPWWWRVGIFPRRNLLPFLFCFTGSGVVFFLVVGNAMRFVPAADVGPLLPGTLPLVVALILVFGFRERIGRLRRIGFAFIALGVVALAGRSLFQTIMSGGDAWRGDLLLLTGATLWAGYVVAFPRTGMSTPEVLGVTGLWSIILLTPFGLPPLVDAIGAGHGWEVVLQFAMQGVAALVALLAFGVALERLGGSRAAAFTGLVPPLAALIAVPALGEHPDAAAIAGIIASSLGVALASGAFERRRA